jgi:hypothetical protein
VTLPHRVSVSSWTECLVRQAYFAPV